MFVGVQKSQYIFLTFIGAIVIQPLYASVQDTAIYDNYEVAPAPVGDPLSFGAEEAIRKAIATSVPWNQALMNGSWVRFKRAIKLAQQGQR